MIHSIAEAKKSDLAGKVVFLRGSADVPMKDDMDIHDISRIKDASRIDSFLPTLEYLMQNGARVVLQPGWVGRPVGAQKEFSTIPVFLYIKDRLEKKGLKNKISFCPSEVNGELRSIAKNFPMVKKAISLLKDGQVLVLENPRFDDVYDKGDEAYAKTLASMVDVYVADDFAQRHRPAADIVPMAKMMKKKYAGFSLMSEIEYVRKMAKELEKKNRKPFVFILAGKKIETKPGVVSKITVALKLLDRMKKGDCILTGGALAYAFLAAKMCMKKIEAYQGAMITLDEVKAVTGSSYIPEEGPVDQVVLAGHVLMKAKEKGIPVVIPQDHLIAKGEETKVSATIPAGWAGVDIGPKTTKQYVDAIMAAGFVVMAGPVGMFDKKLPQAAAGSTAVAKALADATKKGVVTVSAGGESTLLVNTVGVKISHASIGGGSTLEFMEKGSLPGIDALES
ncbi:MAG: phosphoglycerate kinase [Candidatus Aenigmatarchaeota archaeon]